MTEARTSIDLPIVDVVQRLSLCRDIGSIAAVLRAAARALTGADGVTVILREGEQCHYADEDAIAPLWKGQRFPMYACISGTCMLTGRQIAIEDIYADERIPHDLYRPTFVQSLVVTPIREADPIGAIGAYWSARHTATEDELAMLTALARSAAVAFQNVSLIAALTSATRRKDEFLLMLAHELRNPLSPVLNAAHLLRSSGGLDSRGAWAVDVIERQVEHLSRMTGELLDTSRIVSGKVRLQRTRTDLGRALREVLEDHRTQAEAAGVDLEADIAETHVCVQADGTRLGQVLANVTDNAIKFTPASGRVKVTLRQEDGQAVLRWHDNGMGVDPAFLPHMFESFAQEDRSLERTHGGLGLGLTIARSLAEAHGGALEARSDGTGKGTEVTLRMPLDPEPAAIDAGPHRAPTTPARTPLKVLVVEDNVDAADSLRMLLEIVGHSVRVARDGAEGVAAARAFQPDMVLCDIGLPKLDGYQVARAIRADPATARARLIAVTGYGSEEACALTREAGFDEHLTKPVAPEALLGRLDFTPAEARRAAWAQRED